MRWHNSKPKQEIKLEDIFNDEKKQGVKDLIDAHKQETLEEAAEHNYPGGDVWTEEQAVIRRLAFKNGAKWQQERMYSEEEVYNLLLKLPNFINMSDTQKREEKREWFEQFKKK
jgi:hypothetical protein